MLSTIMLAAEEVVHEANGSILSSDFDEVIWGTVAFLIVATIAANLKRMLRAIYALSRWR